MKNETFIQNEPLLQAYVHPAHLATLRARAEQHRRHASIEFKVLECSDTTLVVRVVQGRSHAGNYFAQKRLVEIVRETFADLGPWTTIRARPIPYTPSPTDEVTPEWITEQMKARGLKTVDVARALGMDAASVSALKNGVRPLSGVGKAAFYYYLKTSKCLGLLEKMKAEADHNISMYQEPNAASWGHQEGVLISNQNAIDLYNCFV